MEDGENLYNYIHEELKNPTIPVPDLQNHYFPTYYQNLVAKFMFTAPNEMIESLGIFSN